MPPKGKRATAAPSKPPPQANAAKKKSAAATGKGASKHAAKQTSKRVGTARKVPAMGGKRNKDDTSHEKTQMRTTRKAHSMDVKSTNESRSTAARKRASVAAAAAPSPSAVEPQKKAARKEAAVTTPPMPDTGNANEAGAASNSAQREETAKPSLSSSLLRRYTLPSSSLPDTAWNVSDAVVFSTFLAQIQFQFIRCCCQLLAKLTTATSPAFLHAAALGEAALTSAASGEEGPTTDADQLLDRQELAYRTIRATIAASCTLGHRSCQVLWGPRGSGKHRILRLLAQEVRRTPSTFVMELHGALLRDDEAALGVIAQQLYAFLQSPQSLQLRQAHYLLRTGAFGFGQLFHFERRMDVAAAAAAGASTTTMASGAADDSLSTSRAAGGRRGGAAQGAAGASSNRQTAKVGVRRGRPAEALSSESGGDSEDDEDTVSDEDTEMMVTSTTTYLTGGAASALPHLQRALLLLKSQGCNLVVCIRDIDLFGIRCDQLLYVLSGLMHDSEGSHGSGGSGSGGGGLSLVLASAAPDIRQLEKRLSSRLTCETRYVPLLPWSLAGLMAATLRVMEQDASSQLRLRELIRERGDALAALRDGATKLRRGHESTSRRRAEEKALKELQVSMATLEAHLHATEANLREVRSQRRHILGLLDADSTGITGAGAGLEARASPAGATAQSAKALHDGVAAAVGGGSATSSACESGWRWQPARDNSLTATAAAPAPSQQSASSSSSVVVPRTWTVESLLAHPSLAMEVQGVVCEELLRQLRVAATALRTSNASRDGRASPTLAAASLVQRITSLGVEVEVESGTCATVLAILASALCKTASGEVDLLGAAGRHVLLQWLRGRLQHEPIPPRSERCPAGQTNSSACPPGLPARILTRWRESAQVLVPRVQPPLHHPDAASRDIELSSEGGASLVSPFAVASEDCADNRGRASVALPPLSLQPPHLFDLFAAGQLVGMGYGSRELMLVLFYMHLHYTTGVRQRTVADLLEDVSSSLGTRAAAALDREAFRYAIRLLCRWRLLTVVESHSQLVQLCGSDARLRDFLSTVLSKQPAWCEAELGLDAGEVMRFRNLV